MARIASSKPESSISIGFEAQRCLAADRLCKNMTVKQPSGARQILHRRDPKGEPRHRQQGACEPNTVRPFQETPRPTEIQSNPIYS